MNREKVCHPPDPLSEQTSKLNLSLAQTPIKYAATRTVPYTPGAYPSGLLAILCTPTKTNTWKGEMLSLLLQLMKATVLTESSFIFSPGSLHYAAVYRHESGKRCTLPFFLRFHLFSRFSFYIKMFTL